MFRLLALLSLLLTAASAQAPGDLEILANEQESEGPLSRARGAVEVRTGDIVLTADEADYNETTGEIEARGNVRYRNLDAQEELFASKLAYNVRTELGTFYDVSGFVSSASQGGARILTTDNPFYIEGAVVHKTKNEYLVFDGSVTNCDVDSKWWTLRAPKTKIIPGESATIHRGVFRLKGVPIFYFPIFKKSLERLPRRSGFLTPNVGSSSRFGFILGGSFFWAINRSYDATIGGLLYTDRGIASEIGFRGRPTRRSSFDAVFFGVKDRGVKLDDGSRGEKQGGSSVTMRGSTALPGGFRGVADVKLLSSLAFRQAFTQTFEEAVFSQARSIGYVTKSFSTFDFNTAVIRQENFQTLERDNTIVIRKLPSVEFNSRERLLTRGVAPVYFSFDSSAGLVSRSQRAFETRNFVERTDLAPKLTSQLGWKGFHVTPALSARQTMYGQSRREGQIVGENLYRTSFEASLDVAPPSLARIYNGPKFIGDKVKHVIEPRLRYRYAAGIDEFDRVIRFDERDVLSNTHEADISLANRIYVKNEQTGIVREALTFEVWQRRYFDDEFGGAIVPGRRNVLETSLDLTPVAFLDQPRRYSPIVSSLRIQPTWRHAFEWRNDYDPLRGRITLSSIAYNGLISSLIGINIEHQAVRAPTILSPPSNQLRSTVRFGDFNRRGWNGAFNMIYDYRQRIFVYSTAQVSYNTDCCGFGFEVRRLAIGPIRNENQFRVSLSIANVGSFGTLRPQERLF